MRRVAGAQVSWTRAARTDKGVSAVGQVVALKARALRVRAAAQRAAADTHTPPLCSRMPCSHLSLLLRAQMVMEPPGLIERINDALPANVRYAALRACLRCARSP